MRPGESPEVFLDTTFILPFFQIDIEVEGFDLAEFAEVLSKLPKVHLSELSIFEAKAVLRRLSREEPAYLQALNVGTLVTEDGEILRLREHAEFKEPRLGKLKILRWKELRSARLS